MRVLWSMMLLVWPLQPLKSGVDHHFLCRLTYYTRNEDPYSQRGLTSTGSKLQEGIAAVDPKIIHYGARILIPGLGIYVAGDTGRDVVSRKAAKLRASSFREFQAPVIDIFVNDPKKLAKFPEYVDCWLLEEK